MLSTGSKILTRILRYFTERNNALYVHFGIFKILYVVLISYEPLVFNAQGIVFAVELISKRYLFFVIFNYCRVRAIEKLHLVAVSSYDTVLRYLLAKNVSFKLRINAEGVTEYDSIVYVTHRQAANSYIRANLFCADSITAAYGIR